MKVIVIPVTPFQQNCSLLWDENTLEGALVDPGGDIEKIQQAVNEHNVIVTKIILTHGHLDHVGASVECSKLFGVEIIGPHIGDKFWLDGMLQQSQMFGFKPIPPFLPTKWLEAGENIKIGNLSLEVRHCPGHTPGHVVLFESTSKQVIVGDVLFAGSIGRTDFPKGDQTQLLSSIKESLFSLPEETIVYPGHGPTTTIGHEKKTNPFLAHGQYG